MMAGSAAEAGAPADDPDDRCCRFEPRLRPEVVVVVGVDDVAMAFGANVGAASASSRVRRLLDLCDARWLLLYGL